MYCNNVLHFATADVRNWVELEADQRLKKKACTSVGLGPKKYIVFQKEDWYFL